jgi:flagellar basal-body rod protein FlgB
MSIISNQAINLLERSLDAASLRQKVLSNNIANIDTPNFKRSDVAFEKILRQTLDKETLAGRRTDERHIQIGNASVSEVRPVVYTERHSSLRNDGNNVDIDSEMTALATNQIQFNALVQQINHHFGMLKYAISEGKR